MAGISAISISAPPLSSAVNGAPTGQDKPAALETEKSLSVDLSKVRDTANSEASASAAADEEPAHIKQLRQMIQKLQKLLAEQLKQMQAIASSKMDDTLKAAAVAAAQAAAGATMASIATATSALLKALTENGGSGSGSLVSTSA